MNARYSKWSDVKAKGASLDPRTEEEQASGATAARERREAHVRGFQPAEIRQAADLTQAELARTLGVSRARISKIEHGEVSGINVARDYITALGGHLDLVATLGDRTWKVR
ncbi:helix-turn-helix transcriptional regulator [Actinocorallia libanotica]|uniref:Helix-turn-helix domain-containing protein n=1 Tax=Actinocorallia libanotica TaxID=46162 RepID=A0ABP4CFX6_9ACTN